MLSQLRVVDLLPRRGSRPAPRCRLSRGTVGSTLVEVVVATAMLAVALLGVYGVIAYSSRSFGLAEAVLETQQSTRFVVDRIAEETRWADAVLPDARCRPTLLCPDRLILHVPAANPLRPGSDYQVEFSIDPATRAVVRRQGQDAGALGSGFVEMVFRFFTAEGMAAGQPGDVARVELTVTAGRASRQRTQRTLQTDIALRNRRPDGDEATAAAVDGRVSALRPAPHASMLAVQPRGPDATPGLLAAPPRAARPPAPAPLSAQALPPQPRPAAGPRSPARPVLPPVVLVSRGKAASGPALYAVQVSVVPTRAAAVSLSVKLQQAGFAPYFVPVGSGYAVRLGAFRERARAAQIVQQATARGFPATILPIR